MALNFRRYCNGQAGRGICVEVYWWDGTHRAQRGVFYSQATADAGTSPVAAMGYYFVRDCFASNILGHEYSEYLGRVGDLFPGAERYGTDFRQFHRNAILQPGDRQEVYHAWAFHCRDRVASDGVHCPVNFLWQDPSMVGETYHHTAHWFILMDIHDPEICLESREVFVNGLAMDHRAYHASSTSPYDA